MTDIKVEKSTIVSNQPLKKAEFDPKSKGLLSVFDRYDSDKNGEISLEETKKANAEIFSFCGIMGFDKPNKEKMTAQGLDPKSIINFGRILNNRIYSDGKIDTSLQGYAGNCWLLAGINALSKSEKGQQTIEDAIKSNNDGTFEVTLNGVNKSYTITPKDFEENIDYISMGDSDMKLIELAALKYRKELIQNKNTSNDYTDLARFTYKASKRDSFGGGGFDEQGLFYLTGKQIKKYTLPEYMVESEKKKGTYFPLEKAGEYLDNIMNDKSQYASVASFKKFLGEMYPEHSYTLARVEKDNVIVINPYNSDQEITIKREDFIKNLDSFACLDLNN